MCAHGEGSCKSDRVFRKPMAKQVTCCPSMSDCSLLRPQIGRWWNEKNTKCTTQAWRKLEIRKACPLYENIMHKIRLEIQEIFLIFFISSHGFPSLVNSNKKAGLGSRHSLYPTHAGTLLTLLLFSVTSRGWINPPVREELGSAASAQGSSPSLNRVTQTIPPARFTMKGGYFPTSSVHQNTNIPSETELFRVKLSAKKWSWCSNWKRNCSN